MYRWERVGTFSIVAADLDEGYWGVAVSTFPPCVGAVVPWSEWRVGSIATQSFTNYWYGPRGLELLRRGTAAEEVVRRLTRPDTKRDIRQLGVIDSKGRVAAWTGKKCVASASQILGDGFSCQGNMLANDTVIPKMAAAFESKRGTLASRMFAGLEAAARAGGDRRGMRSAAMLVTHREPWFEKEWGNDWINLRVDQHRHPVQELGRLLRQDEKQTRKFVKEREAKFRRQRHKRS